MIALHAGPEDFASFRHRALAALGHLLQAIRNRRDFARLGEMSDIELADIGLTRADLLLASDLPLGSDPTARLGAIARRREEGPRRAA